MRPYGAKIQHNEEVAYALALCLGHRRADVAAIRWSDIENVGANVVQSKTAKALWIPMLPELKKVLESAERKGETIAVNRMGYAPRDFKCFEVKISH